MQKIPLKLAKAGMVLARDVFRGDSPTGMPICGRETVLSDSLIQRLEQLDVQAVQVEGHPVWEEGSHSLDELLSELGKRFDKSLHNPLNATLFEIYRAHLVRSMGGECGRQAD